MRPGADRGGALASPPLVASLDPEADRRIGLAAARCRAPPSRRSKPTPAASPPLDAPAPAPTSSGSTSSASPRPRRSTARATQRRATRSPRRSPIPFSARRSNGSALTARRRSRRSALAAFAARPSGLAGRRLDPRRAGRLALHASAPRRDRSPRCSRPIRRTRRPADSPRRAPRSRAGGKRRGDSESSARCGAKATSIPATESGLLGEFAVAA